MSLYNVTNFTGSPNPAVWLKTANSMAGGVVGVGLVMSIYVIAFAIMAARSGGRAAFYATNFITFTISVPLWLLGMINPAIIYLLAVLVALSIVMLFNE